jgi:chromosome partitioning protein
VGLARRGHRTLVVDVDGQANATWTLLGGRGADAPTLAAVLTRQASADEAIRPTAVEGLDLLPADPALGGVNVALAQELGRDTRLRSALASLEGRYDYLLFDTGPAFSTLLANVLVATAEVIVPLDPGVYAVLGLVELEGVIAEVKEAYNPSLRLAGLLLTKVARNNVVRDVERGLRDRFGTLVYSATIPLSAKFEEAATRGTTILAHAPKSPGAVAYDSFIEEVIGHGRAKKRGRGPSGGRPGASDAA